MSHKLTAQIVRYCDILLFSLLRGSGLKSLKIGQIFFKLIVLPLTREWIEISSVRCIFVALPFSLLRGSGLK